MHCALNLFLSQWSFQSLFGLYGPDMLAALVTVHAITVLLSVSAEGASKFRKCVQMKAHADTFSP